MTITNEQLIYIEEQLKKGGIINIPLREDLLDHFSCVVEGYMQEGLSFNHSFDLALDRIAPDGLKKIEEDLNYLLTLNREIMLRKIVFLTGYLGVFVVIVAFALSLPGNIIPRSVAGMMAMGGIFLFSISVVPFYFYLWYKKSLRSMQESQ